MELLLRGLAVWRLSSMLVNEDGPLLAFWHLRRISGIEYSDYSDKPASWPDWNPLTCIYCTSVWAGLLLAILPKWISWPLALSGVAALIEDVKHGSSQNSN